MAVFYRFFNVQSKGMNESKKKSDHLKIEMGSFDRNPFYNENIKDDDSKEFKVKKNTKNKQK